MVIAPEPIISERPTALVEGDDGWIDSHRQRLSRRAPRATSDDP
jgi:hypothetical protein